MLPNRRALLITILLAATFIHSAMIYGAESDSPQAVFDRRIMPIFKSPNPSSCTQCHLAAVDLKNYILPSSEKTFLSLRDQGLIDLANPDESKILKLINMREDIKAGAELIQEKSRRLEYEAFSEWIKSCAADAHLVGLPKLKPTELAKPNRPLEVIRHARKDQLLESFENNIWAMRFRCMSCHVEGSQQNNKLRSEYGDQVAWMKSAGPEATMNYLIQSKLIDLKRPENSLLLLKPLMAVEHKGGKKFLPGDQGYKAFRAWIEDYVKTVGDKYPTAAALPKSDNTVERFGSNIWLKLSNTAPHWGTTLIQTDVYAWDAAKNAWETRPIATTDRQNNPTNRIFQHTLTLIADKESPRAKQWSDAKPRLTPGRYLVRVYVDARGKTANNWTLTLGQADYVGQTEFQANWAEDYGGMTVVDTAKLQP